MVWCVSTTYKLYSIIVMYPPPPLSSQCTEIHSYDLCHGGVCELSIRCSWLLCPNTGLSKHGNPVFLHFWVLFLEPSFCVSIPIENVFCSFVQAAGRDNMGGKVLV